MAEIISIDSAAHRQDTVLGSDLLPGLDLNLLMLFRGIMTSGSISQAALRLRMPKATLSRKLRVLERQVGAVLVKRGSRRLETTEIGQALLQRCGRIATETHDASMLASEMQSQLRGVMRISMPIGLAGTWVSRAMADFARLHPQMRLCVHVTNRWIDVTEESYDIAICIGRVRNEQLPSRRLAQLPRGVFASPSYCERRGVPRSPAELADHDRIVLESQVDAGLWPSAGAAARLTTTDIMVVREMALAGVGIGMLTHAVCEADVTAGRLLRLLPQWRIDPVVISAVFLERRHMPLRVRTFIDLLAQSVAEEEANAKARAPGI
jgi:DNA-binding transcriptional LysR family regulator